MVDPDRRRGGRDVVVMAETRLERFERRTEWPLAGTAVLFLTLYSIDVLRDPQGLADRWLGYAMVATYLGFVADYCARLYLAQPRGRWFVRHLLDLAIIALPALRPLRLLSLAVVIDVLQRAFGDTIRGKVIVYTAGGVLMLTYTASLAVYDVERHYPDAHIKTFGDALWWSAATVSTVGYGDVTPVTVGGRLIAVALMVGGVSLLGVVTATLASWIVQRVAEEDSTSTAATAAHIEELREEIRRLAEALPESAPRTCGDSTRIDGGASS